MELEFSKLPPKLDVLYDLILAKSSVKTSYGVAFFATKEDIIIFCNHIGVRHEFNFKNIDEAIEFMKKETK